MAILAHVPCVKVTALFMWVFLCGYSCVMLYYMVELGFPSHPYYKLTAFERRLLTKHIDVCGET